MMSGIARTSVAEVKRVPGAECAVPERAERGASASKPGQLESDGEHRDAERDRRHGDADAPELHLPATECPPSISAPISVRDAPEVRRADVPRASTTIRCDRATTSSRSLEYSKHGRSLLGAVPESPVDLLRGPDVEAARRVLRDDDRRPAGQLPGHHDLLLVAAAERGGRHIRIRRRRCRTASSSSAVRARAARQSTRRPAIQGSSGFRGRARRSRPGRTRESGLRMYGPPE